MFVTDGSVNGPLGDLAGAAPMGRKPTMDLINERQNQEAWQFATTAAKEGDVEAARRENMLWRKMNRPRKGTSSKSPEPGPRTDPDPDAEVMPQ
mmetsp:Transcript_102820/g.314543  ORF Transcript_102820/g.314543 Transcript_102820/m.314543 type:complete len:94 (-) Transcript_102820:29-310(-)